MPYAKMKWIRAYNRRCLQRFLKHVNASEEGEKRYMRHVNIFDKVLIVNLTGLLLLLNIMTHRWMKQIQAMFSFERLRKFVEQ